MGNHEIDVCRDVGFDAAAHQIELILGRLTKTVGPSDFGAIRAQILSIYDQIYIEINSRKFVRIANDRAEYLDGERVFGDEVWTAFPNARDDVRESGNCLAAECTTGAVFHLMRAAEVALRALAVDRSIQFSQGTIDGKQWGEMLEKLRKYAGDLYREQSTHWPSEGVKQGADPFLPGSYSGVSGIQRPLAPTGIPRS